MKKAPTPTTRAVLDVQTLPLSRLKPHPRNPRKHPEPGTPGWEALAASLKDDYFDPLVWNKRNGQLVSGHLRAKVLASQGMTHADVVVKDYDEVMHYAKMLAANHQQGTNDFEAVAALLDEINAGGLNHLHAGLTEEDFKELIASAAIQKDQGFLSGNTGAGGSGEAWAAGDPGDGENFTFVVVLKAEQHVMVMNMLKTVRENESLPNNSEAMLHIFRAYNKKKK